MNMTYTQRALRTLIQTGALADKGSALWSSLSVPVRRGPIAHQHLESGAFDCTIEVPVILGGDREFHTPAHDFVELLCLTDGKPPALADLWGKVYAPLDVVLSDSTQDHIDSGFRVRSGNRYARLEPNGNDTFEVVAIDRVDVQGELDPALGAPKTDSPLAHFFSTMEGQEMNVEGQPHSSIPYCVNVLVATVRVTLGFDFAQDDLSVPAGDAQHCADLLVWALDQINDMSEAYNEEGLPTGLAVSMPAARRFIALTTKGGAK